VAGGTCGYGAEISSSINAGNFLTSCKVYWLASQDTVISVSVSSSGGDVFCATFIVQSLRL
jgi:hypothetical protein